MVDRLDRAFVGVLAALAAVHLALFGHYFAATMIRRPYWDMFHYIVDYLDYRRAGGFLGYLWQPYVHTEHRQIWMRLLTAIDIGAFGGVAYPFLAAATICLISVPFLLWREIARSRLPRDLAGASGCMILLLSLTTSNVVDCSIPIEGIYPQTVVFAILSLLLFDGADESSPSSNRRRLGALLAAVGAGFACAVGLVLWPILAWAAWRGGLGWRWVGGIAALGGGFVGLYLHGVGVSATSAAALQGDARFYAEVNLLRVGDALLTFLGLPWTRAPILALAGRLAGAALLALGIVAVVERGLRRAPDGRLERIAVGLILFSLATAAAAAVGRLHSAETGILPVRYSVLLLPLHAGLVCLALPWLRRRWAQPAGRRVAQAALAGAAGLLLVQQLAAGEVGARKAEAMRATIDRFMAGGRDPAMTAVVYGDLDYAQRVVDAMRREGIYREVN